MANTGVSSDWPAWAGNACMHMGSPASIGRVSRRWRGSRAHHGRQPALSKCARCQDKGSSQLACRYAYEAHGPDTPAKLKQGHCRDGKGVAGAASTLNCAFAQASRLSQPPHLCCTQPTQARVDVRCNSFLAHAGRGSARDGYAHLSCGQWRAKLPTHQCVTRQTCTTGSMLLCPCFCSRAQHLSCFQPINWHQQQLF